MESNEDVLRINIGKIFDENNPSGCGYCKHQTMKKFHNKNIFKIYLDSIPVDIMQNLLSKGWGRSGDVLYKYNYEKTCCKLYQPRVNINNFKISKEQKKIMKRFRKYLSGEFENDQMIKLNGKMKNIDTNFISNEKEKVKKEEDIIQINIENKFKEYMITQSFLDIIYKYIQNEDDLNDIYGKILKTKVRKNNNKKLKYDYSCDLIFIIKNMLISIKKRNDINKNTINIINNNNQINNINMQKDNYVENQNIINDLYNDFIKFQKPNLDNETISFNNTTGHINFKINDINKEHNKEQKKGQIKDIKNFNNNDKININHNIISIINNNNKEKYIFDYFKEIVPEPEIYLPLKHNYTLELTGDINVSSIDERFLLYKKYQLKVHKKYSTEEGYNRFLGNSPLIKKQIIKPKDLNFKTKHPELYPDYYGTYNLIHRIDGKIVAVTVIDIFPNYLDSIYCYYDPDFSFLDLGVYTAIREIEYAKSFQELIDKNFIYYTMGEMSQSVTKLKYKGNYFPTEIMDHYTEKYVFLTEKIKALIGDNECHCLFEKFNKNKDGYFSKEEIDIYINNIIIDVFGEQVLFEDLINLYLEDNSKAKNQIPVMMRGLMEIIDIETFSIIKFYFNMYE